MKFIATLVKAPTMPVIIVIFSLPRENMDCTNTYEMLIKRMIGAVISIFIIGFLRYGLGLANVTSQVLIIITGLLLIFAVMVPNLKFNILKKKKV